jgi:hypothetical protein
VGFSEAEGLRASNIYWLPDLTQRQKVSYLVIVFFGELLRFITKIWDCGLIHRPTRQQCPDSEAEIQGVFYTRNRPQRPPFGLLVLE